MFRLPDGANKKDFEQYFTQKHSKEAAEIPGLRKYTIGKVIGAPEGEPAWYRINELWFDDLESAKQSLNSKTAALCTEDLLPRVCDFTGVFVEDTEVELPS
jgi:uncharacterized protein (TIGR02118 family)